MPYSERDFLPISALQHLVFCERQCALIHLERQWMENRFTAEGGVLHRRAHAGRRDTRPAGRTARAVPLRSAELGLYGVADVVQRRAGEPPLPVEYKRGRPKSHDADRVQLCAQALCLEEMFGVPVPAGEIFYGTTRRRLRVEFDDALRARTRSAVARLRELIVSGRTVPAEPGPKCRHCSLKDICLPKLAERGRARPASHYIRRAVAESLRDGCPDPGPAEETPRS
jgi:CRISPR-associated exonuclease Cas4